MPSSVPGVLGGVRIALSLSLVVAVVTEMFTGTVYGLGKTIYDAAIVYDTPMMYAGIVVAGLLGYAVNAAVIGIETRIAKWAF